MGVVIHAYKGLKKIDCVFDADGKPMDPATREEPAGDWVQLYVNPDFDGRADEIEHKGVYAYEDEFRGVSIGYWRYNALRDELAKIAGYPIGEYEEYGSVLKSHCVACWNGAQGPFSELIKFSDCEGTIGAAVSSKLAMDFAEFQAKASEHESEYFRDFYSSMRKSFELASENGAVRLF